MLSWALIYKNFFYQFITGLLPYFSFCLFLLISPGTGGREFTLNELRADELKGLNILPYKITLEFERVLEVFSCFGQWV